MWGVYPEALAWNVGGVQFNFNFGERIWRSGPQRANLKVHFKNFCIQIETPPPLAPSFGQYPKERHTFFGMISLVINEQWQRLFVEELLALLGLAYKQVQPAMGAYF